MFELKTYNNDSGSDGTPPASKPSGPKFLQKMKTKAFGLEPEDQQAKREIIDEEYSFVFLYQLKVGDSNLWRDLNNKRKQIEDDERETLKAKADAIEKAGNTDGAVKAAGAKHKNEALPPRKKIDLVTYFRNNHDQVKIDKNATVMMCYVEINVEEKENEKKNKASAHEDVSLPCSITGAIFKYNWPVAGEDRDYRQNKYTSKCKNFQQDFNFPKDSQEKLEIILENRMKEINQKIEHIKLIQKRLPKALHNYNEYDNLIQDYYNLQSQGNQTIYAKYYYDDLIILYCGNYLKYGRLVKNKNGTGSHSGYVHTDTASYDYVNCPVCQVKAEELKKEKPEYHSKEHAGHMALYHKERSGYQF